MSLIVSPLMMGNLKFDPMSIMGIAPFLWLDPTKGVQFALDGLVNAWVDEVGSSECIAMHDYCECGYQSDLQGGLPMISMMGSGWAQHLRCEWYPGQYSLTGLTFIVVGRYFLNGYTFSCADGADVDSFGFLCAANEEIYVGGHLFTGYTRPGADTHIVVISVGDNGLLKYYVDGVCDPNLVDVSNHLPIDITRYAVGGHFNGGVGTYGTNILGDILLYPKAFNASEVDYVTKGFAARWGLSFS